MRELFVTLHRWMGLATAGFLFVLGLSGALLSWGYEIDEALNPELYAATRGEAPFKSGLELAAIVEADDARARVTGLPMAYERGRPAIIEVAAGGEKTGGPRSLLGYNQVFVDPVTGRIMGRRNLGDTGFSRPAFVPLVYALHYTFNFSFQGPSWFGSSNWYTRRLFGAVGAIWAINCLIGFYVTWPQRRAKKPAAKPVDGLPTGPSFWKLWKPAWKVAWNKGAYRVTFDLHRAFALWALAFLFLQGFSSMGVMNVMQRNVVVPFLALFGSHPTPGPFTGWYHDLGFRGPFGWNYQRKPVQKPVAEPLLGFADALRIGAVEAAKRGWQEPVGRILYTTQISEFYPGNAGVYRVRFFVPGEDARFTTNITSNQLKELHVDAVDGSIVGSRVPWQGTVTDIVLQQAFPLHSSVIYGYWGRVICFVLGVGTAMLSVTGVVIWFKKRQARLKYAASLAKAAARKAALETPSAATRSNA